MKKMKKILGSLAAMGMVLSLVIPAQAAPPEYSYKIRVFAGNEGKFAEGGSSVKDYTNGAFRPEDVIVNDEKAEDGSTYKKYYVKGIKPSGSDVVMTTLSNPTFRDAKKDMDYVVVYGIKGDMEKYTVEYLDANGNTLADSQVYEGNIGDKPIVPYLYIEGYMPQAYSLTKTLVKDPDGTLNVFTFKYTRISTGGGGGGDTTVYDEEIVTTTNTTPVIVPGAGDDAAAGDTAGGGVAVVPGDGDAADAGAGAGAGDAGEAAAPEEPQELIDLDDEEVPLANIPGSNGGGIGVGSEPGSFFVNMPPAVIVGVVSMAVLVVAAAWYLIFKRKNKGTGEDGQE